MLLRLPVAAHCFLGPARRCYSSAPASIAVDPLRILFCGSDHFSIASLRALVDAKHDLPTLIESIHVAHRPAKPTGRGLKKLTDVPIKQVATHELNLKTHAIDTFTGWAPPDPINLVIAVSFGLLVPPRILNLAEYGGLNVHPSLLPDLRGPAPIEHAVLNRRSHTGVSIQTLHPKHFDQGTILAQTPAPGIPIPRGTTAATLETQLATTGADMLLDVLKSHKFVPPLQDVGWYAASDGPTDHAGKIAKSDRFIDFSVHTMDEILARLQALGNPWCILPSGDRLIIHDIAIAEDANVPADVTGIHVRENSPPLIRTACGSVGYIISSTYAGGKAGQGNAKLIRNATLA